MNRVFCKGYYRNSCGQPVLSDGLCKNCRAAKFEDDVADVFRLMGFTVEKNRHLGGRQVDMYVEYKQNIVTVRGLVECKYHMHSNVGADEVSQIVATASPWLTIGSLQCAYLVTTRGFAAPARENAERNRIECYTYDELLSQLIDFKPYLKRRVEEFESSKLINTYVDLSFRKLAPIHNPHNRLDAASQYFVSDWELVRKKIIPFMKRWLSFPEPYHLSVLGDFGAGKTSFCTYFGYVCAKLHLDNPTRHPRIPLLIRLGNFARLEKGSVQAMVTDFLVNDCGLHTNYATFQKFLSSGKLLLLLDGFDEMAMQVDERVRLRNFEVLAELAQPGNKVILTGRTGYFPSLSEIRKVMRQVPEIASPYDKVKDEVVTDGGINVRYELLRLEPFSKSQIDTFLKKHAEQLQRDGVTNWQEMSDAIRGTYNLKDLASRPVLLEIIIQTIPRLKGEIHDLNLYRLYDIYTKLWLKRDWDKGDMRRLITTEERELFMQELSLDMYRSGEQSIHFTNLPTRIQKFFKIKEKSTLDYFDHDVRTCTFLNRTDDGHYKFVHKSFMEYFVAMTIVDSIRSKKPVMLDETKLTDEVLLFVSAGISQHDTDMLLGAIDAGRTANYTTNTLKIAALSSKGRIAGRAFSKTDLKEIQLNDITFDNCDLASCDLKRAHLKRVHFVNCNLRGTDFQDARLDSPQFIDCDLTRANFRHARFGDTFIEVKTPKKQRPMLCGVVTFKNCKLYNANMRGNNFTNSCFADSDLSGANLQNVFFHQCDFEGVSFERSNLNGGRFAGCKLYKCSFIHTYMRRAKFIAYSSKRTLYGYPAHQVKSNDFENSSFIECNLRQSLFAGQFVKNATFTTSTFLQAAISGCRFVSSKFSKIDLSETRLVGSSWINCAVDDLRTEGAIIVRSHI